MFEEKIYEYLVLIHPDFFGHHDLSKFRFRSHSVVSYGDECAIEVASFTSADGDIQRDVLEMLYPGYPWDLIIKIYNEAPRNQK